MVSGVKKGSQKGRLSNNTPKHILVRNTISHQYKNGRTNGNNEAIAKAVADATWVAIQTLSEVQSQRSEDQRGPKLGGPVLKQPQFNWEATDKYKEWKAFILQVRKCPFHIQYPRTRQDCNGKELARQEGSTLFRIA